MVFNRIDADSYSIHLVNASSDDILASTLFIDTKDTVMKWKPFLLLILLVITINAGPVIFDDFKEGFRNIPWGTKGGELYSYMIYPDWEPYHVPVEYICGFANSSRVMHFYETYDHVGQYNTRVIFHLLFGRLAAVTLDFSYPAINEWNNEQADAVYTALNNALNKKYSGGGSFSEDTDPAFGRTIEKSSGFSTDETAIYLFLTKSENSIVSRVSITYECKKLMQYYRTWRVDRTTADLSNYL